MKTDLNEFRDHVEQRLKKRFTTEMYVEPMVFLLSHDGCIANPPIPDELLRNGHAKEILSLVIKDMCKLPLIKAAALAAEVNITDERGRKQHDGIFMMVSSHEEEIITVYTVDRKKRNIKEMVVKDITGATGHLTGLFKPENN